MSNGASITCHPGAQLLADVARSGDFDVILLTDSVARLKSAGSLKPVLKMPTATESPPT